jgi:hypothetical protein
MISFGILVHTDVAMVRRLIRVLSPNPIILHIDAKSENFADFCSLATDNVTLADCVSVNWAGFSLVEAMKNIFVKFLQNPGEDNDRIVLLSGLDYPIKPITNLSDFFNLNDDVEFCRYFEIDESSLHYKAQIGDYHCWDYSPFGTAESFLGWKRKSNIVVRRLFERTSILRSKKQRPESLIPAHGSGWISFTRKTLTELMSFITPEIDKFFSSSFAPDEKYFHSLLASSSARNATVDKGPMQFQGRGTSKLANLHIIDSSLSKTFTESDWELIKDSPMFFVRKVTSRDSQALLDLIDLKILQPKEDLNL